MIVYMIIYSDTSTGMRTRTCTIISIQWRVIFAASSITYEKLAAAKSASVETKCRPPYAHAAVLELSALNHPPTSSYLSSLSLCCARNLKETAPQRDSGLGTTNDPQEFSVGENSHSSLLQWTAPVSGPDGNVLARSSDPLLHPASSINSGKHSPLLQSAPGIKYSRPVASALPRQPKT